MTLSGVLYLHDLIVADSVTGMRVACCVFILCLALHMTQRPGHPFTLTAAYTGLLGVFHTGLFFQPALGGTFSTLRPTDIIWLNAGSIPAAAYIYSVGQLAFSASTFAVALWRRESPSERITAAPTPSFEKSATVVGSALLIGGLALWFAISLTRGVTILGGSYVNFLSGTGNSKIAYAYLLMGVGLPILATTSGQMRKKLFRVFLAWSAIAFILGLRGEVLIPMTAYLVVRARQRPIKFRAWMAPAAVALLALGALVRTTRVQGLRGAVVNLADVNPLSSLAELGYSIRPLAQVITWQSSSELPVGSGTYTHPVLRALGGHFLNLGLPPASTDPTALNTVVAARVGNIGGSPIAEAFRAGSLPGVILVMVSLGIISGILDARRGGQLFDCLAGGLAFVLFLWVRNTFTPVPLQVGLVLAAVLAVRMAGTANGKRRTVLITSGAPRRAVELRDPVLKFPAQSLVVANNGFLSRSSTADNSRPLVSGGSSTETYVKAGRVFDPPPTSAAGRYRHTPPVPPRQHTSWRDRGGRVVQSLRPIVGVSSGAVSNAGLALAFGILTARILGPTGQGELTVWVTVSSLAVLVLTLGTGTALRVRSRGVPSKSDCAAYAVFTLVAAIVAAALTVAIGLPVHHSSSTGVISAAFLLGFSFMLGRQAGDLLQAAGLTSFSVYSGAVATGVQLLLFAVACLSGHGTVFFALICGSVGYLSQMYFAVHRSRRAGTRPGVRTTTSAVSSLIKIGAPTLGYSVGLLVIQRADRIILAGVLGARSAGIYAAAATLAESIRLVPAAIGQLLFARTAVAQRATGETRHLYKVAATLILGSCAAIIAISGPLVRILFGSQYSGAVPILRGLVIAEIFMGLALLDSRILMGLARTKEVGLISTLLVLIALPTYYLGIKLFGVTGGVISCIVLYAAYAAILWARRRKIDDALGHLSPSPH
nr:O-antigen polysaccharide polymerase Wzy [Allobranchiibius huperziae]